MEHANFLRPPPPKLGAQDEDEHPASATTSSFEMRSLHLTGWKVAPSRWVKKRGWGVGEECREPKEISLGDGEENQRKPVWAKTTDHIAGESGEVKETNRTDQVLKRANKREN